MSAQPSSGEQRQHRRRVLQTTARLTLPGRPPFEVRTTNVSLGGLGIVAAANPPANLVMRVQLALPSTGANQLQVVEFNGRVVHSVLSRRYGGFSIGLAFVDPSPSVLRAVSAYIG